MESTNQAPRRLESVRSVAQRIERSDRWVWYAVQRGEFPQPVRLSARCTRWDSEAIDRWIARQLAAAE
ncbi:AlpA family transcriptional regulator [Comamonas sp. NLF-1-9]|uniref:helix-turn-helix transcriptional regulator n=1 Tax=Comamonas sp. NLF-1-9 TaxID=2853163 RepID=UPI0021074DE7|nr:AlpA family phage regulatory protein [Comamonas sp. NLF-1-9]